MIVSSDVTSARSSESKRDDSGRPSVGWQIARLVLAGSSRQAFLDHRSIEALLRVAPESRRRSLALRLLSLSPHYFIYQWERYSGDWSRQRILEAENERNLQSRRQIGEQLLAPIISADATVLDFGCGPGYLARYVREFSAEVIGVDVSAGTLACARIINPGPSYRLIGDGRLPVADESVDLVYSIAVFQHLDPALWPAFFADFTRVLRPRGRGLCHFAVAEDEPVKHRVPSGMRGRWSLRFEEHSGDAVAAALARAGFIDVRVVPIDGGSSIDDDVGHQHVASFRKPS